MATVTFDHVVKKFGDVTAMGDFNLEVQDGELMVFVGPSGCGKTTCLRMVAGLEEITSGTLKIGDRVVNDIAPKDRDIAMVFQSYALYPHMTVYDNLAFGLKLRKLPKPEIDRRVKEAAETIQLTSLLERRPKELSGGQRQRVALGRAIVREPAVFLMDEPLSNLDAKLRVQTRAEIARLHQRLKTTIIYVTHDQVEAMTMGQRIAVMSQAKLQQVGTPRELYDHPANKFVAGFIGSPAMNFLPAELIGSGESAALTVAGITFVLPAHYREVVGATSGAKFTLGVRPEHLNVAPGDVPTVAVQTVADVVEYLGNEVLLHAMVADVDVVALVGREHHVRPGDAISLHIPLDQFHLFHADSDLAVPRPRFAPARPVVS